MIRTHVTKKVISIVNKAKRKIFKDTNEEKNKKVISIQEYNTIIYSDKMTKAKLAAEYSVLYPDTSSDSDSLKSKGAR